MNVKFLYGEQANLNSTPLAEGQILFTTDTQKIYWDKDERTRIEVNQKEFEKIPGDIKKAIDELLNKDNFTSKTIERDTDNGETLEVKIAEVENNILKVVDSGLQVLSTDGIDYSIKVIQKEQANDGAAKTYTITQEKNHEGSSFTFDIDIPADKVIKSGVLVKITDYDTESEKYQNTGVTKNGTYLKITIDNSDSTEIYINVDELIDIYTASSSDGDVKVQITDHEISASLVDGKVTAEKLAADAVTTEKIADNAITTNEIKDSVVTEAKLDSALQNKLKGLEWQSFTVAEG